VLLLASFMLASVTAAAAVPTPVPSPVLPAVPTVAPGYAAPAVSPPPPSIVGITEEPFVGITLENAIGMALADNPQLGVAQANRRVAQYQIEAAKGAYDVTLSVEPQYQSATSAPQNAFFAGPNFGPIVQNTTSVSAGASGQLPGGQQYNVQISGQQVFNNTTIDTFNPYYPTIFSVNFTQPLGRGRALTAAGHQIEVARLGAEASNEQTLAAVSSTIAQVQNTYWDLVAAWRNVAIQETALKDTIAQQHGDVRMARQGATAPIDVVDVNSQVAVFQQDVFAALQTVATLQNQLKSELTSNPQDQIWQANLVPTTTVLQLPPEGNLASLVQQAIKNRPEIAQIRAQLQTAQSNVAYAADQTKPQVNLQLGYTSNGFAGNVLPPAPFFQAGTQQVTAINELIAAVNGTLPPSQQIQMLPNGTTAVPAYLSGGLNQAIRNMLQNRFPIYTAGVAVSFPIGDRMAKANLAIAQEQQRSAQIQEASTIERVVTDVRNALQAYQSAQAELAAARIARQSSEAVLASEERRFHAGASTTFLVLQREIEVANNRGLELQAQTNLNKAVVQLQEATGSILSANNVNVTTVGSGTP
jgi:outer membrane protein TolC